MECRCQPNQQHIRISHLSLHGYESSLVLNTLILPNLRNLDLFDYPFLDIVLSLVIRSSCVLRSLAIGIEEFEESELSSFLAAFLSLETLKIVVCPLHQVHQRAVSAPSAQQHDDLSHACWYGSCPFGNDALPEAGSFPRGQITIHAHNSPGAPPIHTMMTSWSPTTSIQIIVAVATTKIFRGLHEDALVLD
ncbi:hypothetical protein B0H19DRAFT_1264385 [Mycena capillaripes]|nr:hypothetical protein B0H19DRAFT_1264385 [Mycena capillaripes]